MSVRLLSVLMAMSLFTVTPGYAEESDYFAQFREEFQKNRVDVVGRAMHLSPAEAAKFWPVYEEYDRERQQIVDRRLALLKDYAAALDTMSNRKADELLGRSFALRRDLLALQERYANKLKVALTPILAARFAQVEQQVQLIQDLRLAGRVPLIQEGKLASPEETKPASAVSQ